MTILHILAWGTCYGVTSANTSITKIDTMKSAVLGQKLTADTLVGDTLNEVVVTSRRINYKAGGYTMNVQGNEHFKQMDLSEVIRFLPGASVSEGGLKIHGKQVSMIYLNHRRLRMTGQELIQYLQGYQGRNTKEIEVIMATGAEESASAATGAVIKIRTIRIEDGGRLNSQASCLVETEKFNMMPSIQVDTRRSKWSTYTDIRPSYFYSNMKGESNTWFQSSDYIRKEKTTDRSKIRQLHSTFGVGYDLSKKDYLTADIEYKGDKDTREGCSDATEIHKNGSNISSSLFSDGNNHYDQWMFNTDYHHAWKSGSLTIAGAYTFHGSWQEQKQERTDDGSAWSNAMNDDQSYHHVYGRWTVSQRLPGKSGDISTGMSLSRWNNNSCYGNELVKDNITDKYATFKDHYLYKELNFGSFVSWQFKAGNFSSSLGLRYEHIQIHPQSALSPEHNHQSCYDELFPNIRLNFF